MGMTIAEKILAAHSGRKEVKPGEYVWAKIDGTNIPVIGAFQATNLEYLEKLGIKKLFDADSVFVTNDHEVPPATISQAEEVARIRRIVKKYGISHWYECGRQGVMHQLYPEQGFVRPGELIAAADSHTTSYGAFNAASCAIFEELIYVLAKGELWFRVPESIKFQLTGKLPEMCAGKDVILKIAGIYGTDFANYRSVEFLGPAASEMSLASRWTIANMGIEVGAKFAIFEADQKTFDFLKGRTDKPYTPVSPDPDADYAGVYTLDVTDLEPMVACPHDPGNSKPVSEVAGIKIDQGFIGSCTNGRQEDLEMAAGILKGRRVHPDVRLIISPASLEVWKDALKAGWLENFIEAGACVTHPTCGPCMGNHLGILSAGERCISSTNRNFRGRMGSPESEIYLSNAGTVAASCLTGRITDPRKV
jgi:3-isopropylmalate/(R)-2-methylmalate dehydratase large subunit